MAAQPAALDPESDQHRKIYDVSFLGTSAPYRRRILSELAKTGVSISIFGKDWSAPRPNTSHRSWERLLSDITHYAWPRICAEGPVHFFTACFNRFSF